MKNKVAITETLREKEHTFIFRKWEHTKSQRNNPMFVLTHTPESGRPEFLDYVTYKSAIGSAKFLIFPAALGAEYAPCVDLEEETYSESFEERESEITALAIADFDSRYNVPQPRNPMNLSSKNKPLICTTIVAAGQSRVIGSTSIPRFSGPDRTGL
jgi:hypothetical protein